MYSCTLSWQQYHVSYFNNQNLQGSKLMFTSSQNARDFDNLRVKKRSTSKRLQVRIIHVSQTKGNNGLTSFLVEKNLTSKNLQVHLKVNLEPWIGQWYFEIHNFIKTLKALTNDNIYVESHSLLKCLLRWLSVYCPHATMLQPLAVDSVDMTLQLLTQIIWNQIWDKDSYLHFYHYYYYFINF